MKTWMLAVVLVSVPAYAQQPDVTAADKFEWDQPAATLVEANGLRYDLELDGGPVVAVAVTCAGAASPFVCSAAIPAITPTTHVVRLRAVATVNGTELASAFSAPFSFRMRVAASTPMNVRIKPGK